MDQTRKPRVYISKSQNFSDSGFLRVIESLKSYDIELAYAGNSNFPIDKADHILFLPADCATKTIGKGQYEQYMNHHKFGTMWVLADIVDDIPRIKRVTDIEKIRGGNYDKTWAKLLTLGTVLVSPNAIAPKLSNTNKEETMKKIYILDQNPVYQLYKDIQKGLGVQETKKLSEANYLLIIPASKEAFNSNSSHILSFDTTMRTFLGKHGQSQVLIYAYQHGKNYCNISQLLRYDQYTVWFNHQDVLNITSAAQLSWALPDPKPDKAQAYLWHTSETPYPAFQAVQDQLKLSLKDQITPDITKADYLIIVLENQSRVAQNEYHFNNDAWDYIEKFINKYGLGQLLVYAHEENTDKFLEVEGYKNQTILFDSEDSVPISSLSSLVWTDVSIERCAGKKYLHPEIRVYISSVSPNPVIRDIVYKALENHTTVTLKDADYLILIPDVGDQFSEGNISLYAGMQENIADFLAENGSEGMDRIFVVNNSVTSPDPVYSTLLRFNEDEQDIGFEPKSSFTLSWSEILNPFIEPMKIIPFQPVEVLKAMSLQSSEMDEMANRIRNFQNALTQSPMLACITLIQQNK